MARRRWTKAIAKFNDETKSSIKNDVKLTHLEAKEIAYQAVKKFNLKNVFVDFVFEQKKNWIGLAEHKTRVITLTPAGQKVGTLLHEIAHLMPNGWGHETGWKVNFINLVNWYNSL